MVQSRSCFEYYPPAVRRLINLNIISKRLHLNVIASFFYREKYPPSFVLKRVDSGNPGTIFASGMSFDQTPLNHYLIFPESNFIFNLPLAGYFYYGKNAPFIRVFSHRPPQFPRVVLNSKQVRSVTVVAVYDATTLPAKRQYNA